jgi:hypothetical protein
MAEGGAVGPPAGELTGFEEEGGFHEAFLSKFSPGDRVALRRLAGMVFGYNLEFGKSSTTESVPELREPYGQWAAVGRDIRYLARFLEELGSTVGETLGIDQKEAETIAGLARERVATLEELAVLFEREVEAARYDTAGGESIASLA